MKRLIALLMGMFLALPAYAIGFWFSAGGNAGMVSHGDLWLKAVIGGTSSDTTLGSSGSGTLYGAEAYAGLSLYPIPVIFGAGVGYLLGSGSTTNKAGNMEIKSDWDATLLKVKIPVAYKNSAGKPFALAKG